MTRRLHLRLFFIATLAWIAFFAAGLPSYYQQYSRSFMIWFDGLLLLPLTAVFLLSLRRTSRKKRLRRSLWMAFYFTVPFAVYDWITCGLVLDLGLGFLSRFWYLTVYYVIPWIVLPSLAGLLNRFAPSRAAHDTGARSGDKES